MKEHLNIFLLVFFKIPITTFGQDLHNSQPIIHQSLINPATIGNFEGTIMFGGLYRDQLFTMSPFNFQTAQGYLNQNLSLGYKNNWTSYHIQLNQDLTGEPSLRHTGAKLGLSHNIHFSERKATIAIGLSYFMANRSLDISNARFESMFLNQGGNDPTVFADYFEAISGFDGGLSFTQIHKSNKYSFGIALQNLGKKYDLSGLTSLRRPILNLHSHYERQFDNLTLDFNLFIATQGEASIVYPYFGLMLPLLGNDLKVKYNFGYRLNDALPIGISVLYRQWTFNCTYDITISKLRSANNGNGSIEFNFKKIFQFNSTPKVKPIVLCPRL